MSNQYQTIAQYFLDHSGDVAYVHFRGDETGKLDINRKQNLSNVVYLNAESLKKNLHFDSGVVFVADIDMQVMLVILGLRCCSAPDIRAFLSAEKRGNPMLAITDNKDDIARLVKSALQRLSKNGLLASFEIDRKTNSEIVKKLYALTPLGRKTLIEMYHVPVEEVHFGLLQKPKEWLRTGGLAYAAGALCENLKVASFNFKKADRCGLAPFREEFGGLPVSYDASIDIITEAGAPRNLAFVYYPDDTTDNHVDLAIITRRQTLTLYAVATYLHKYETDEIIVVAENAKALVQAAKEVTTFLQGAIMTDLQAFHGGYERLHFTTESIIRMACMSSSQGLSAMQGLLSIVGGVLQVDKRLTF